MSLNRKTRRLTLPCSQSLCSNLPKEKSRLKHILTIGNYEVCMEILEKINLSDKKEKEILRAIRLAALAQLKEDSPILLSIDDISIMLNRSYNYTNRNIVTLPSFPPPVTVERGKVNGNKFYRVADVIKWQKANTWKAF